MAEASIKRISVTDDHIRRGKRYNHCECPVALALQDVFGVPVDVGVKLASVGYVFYLLPQEVTSFILSFDSRLPVKPFSFDLKIPF